MGSRKTDESIPELNVIAHIESDFPEKFGIPRQSGLIGELRARIVFEPQYRDRNALKGLEEFSHLWLIWLFSETVCENWSPTVRPPRLGGEERVGVFATRSPFRPNPLGLSCVKLEEIHTIPGKGTVLEISGADLMDHTPILDIKPYLAFCDSHPEASHGFTDRGRMEPLRVLFPKELLQRLPAEKQAAVQKVLEQDPRPRYQDDPTRIYGLSFAGFNIRFRVEKEVLTVCEVVDES